MMPTRHLLYPLLSIVTDQVSHISVWCVEVTRATVDRKSTSRSLGLSHLIYSQIRAALWEKGRTFLRFLDDVHD